MALADMLEGARPDMKAISAHLDGLTSSVRIAESRALSGRAQAKLFEAARGFRPIGLAHFVPEDAAPLSEVPHFGRNSLPAFTHFAKEFFTGEELAWVGGEVAEELEFAGRKLDGLLLEEYLGGAGIDADVPEI